MILWVTDVNSRKPVAIPIDKIARFISVNGNYTQTMIELINGSKQECEENIAPLTDQFKRLRGGENASGK
jgi:hypothetical protein